MYEKELEFAEKLADVSGEAVLKYFRRPIDIDDKSDASPVTIADRESEKVMRQLINRTYPSHGIVGEEYGRENEKAEYVWVLDPIDGTQSFITGSPMFGTLIALLHNGVPVVGVISQPYTKERWVGAKGRPSTFNGEVIRTRSCADLSKSALYSAGGKLMFRNSEDLKRFNALSDAVKLVRYSADCYAYGLLAMGCIDLVCEANMRLYDYAALIPVVEGAGGRMCDWNGKPLGTESDGRVLAVGDGVLLDQALQVLNA